MRTPILDSAYQMRTWELIHTAAPLAGEEWFPVPARHDDSFIMFDSESQAALNFEGRLTGKKPEDLDLSHVFLFDMEILASGAPVDLHAGGDLYRAAEASEQYGVEAEDIILQIFGKVEGVGLTIYTYKMVK